MKKALDALLPDSRIFVDANIFLYSILGHLKKYPITIFSIDEGVMDNAVALSKKYGLLISDSVHTAIMKINGIDNIATNDSDFERIEGITIWKP